jgi:hypothetical protein
MVTGLRMTIFDRFFISNRCHARNTLVRSDGYRTQDDGPNSEREDVCVPSLYSRFASTPGFALSPMPTILKRL